MVWETFLVSSGARAAIAGYEYRHQIQHWYKQLLVAADLGATNVLITGLENSGKTILQKALGKEIASHGFPEPRQSKFVERAAQRLGEWTSIVTTVPGHLGGIAKNALQEHLTSNPSLSGVIHVVDFGYWNPRSPAVAARLVNKHAGNPAKPTNDDVLEIRAEAIKQERAYFRSLLSVVRQSFDSHREPTWLILAVAKADLYLDSLTDAEQLYDPANAAGKGPWGRNFGKHLMDVLGTEIEEGDFFVDASPVCCYPEVHRWAGREIQISRKYSRAVEQEMMGALLEKIDNLERLAKARRKARNDERSRRGAK